MLLVQITPALSRHVTDNAQTHNPVTHVIGRCRMVLWMTATIHDTHLFLHDAMDAYETWLS